MYDVDNTPSKDSNKDIPPEQWITPTHVLCLTHKSIKPVRPDNNGGKRETEFLILFLALLNKYILFYAKFYAKSIFYFN
ncbi:hypothetical protein FACS189465_1990 [Clostridia bacterium]|nr:hypothetical protein FACS189465_1990 [Clostridia bacterium]